jgi:hypothetical protein
MLFYANIQIIIFSAVSKYGETAPPTGFFHYFEPNEVLVKVYQPATEEFKDGEQLVFSELDLLL